MRNWLLPENIEDVLPAEAARIEQFRRTLLDLFRVHGYQFVMPPLLEYLESLITGVGHDLDLATFKVVDQLTGRLMGLRADITPQAARIDAHMLGHQGVTRLCYAGDVLRTNPDGLARSRQPLQVGAELYGHANIESDIEIQCLMVKALQMLGIDHLQIDFNHVAIFSALVQGLDQATEDALYAALRSKDQSEIIALTRTLKPETQSALCHLAELNGDIYVLDKAEQVLPHTPQIKAALAELRQVGLTLQALGVGVGYDLAELRGYHYHSGMVFAAYAKGYAGPLALGGRYDEVGVAFGRARPATGFSIDLRSIVTALPPATLAQGILAPNLDDADLNQVIETLRAEGNIVIKALSGQAAYLNELSCNRKLEKINGTWQVVNAPELVQ
jgi:ATP phosphoribosyltransferase regulatory subunit